MGYFQSICIALSGIVMIALGIGCIWAVIITW